MVTDLKELWRSLRISVALWIVCGLVYPLLVTLSAQLFFKRTADGSLVHGDDGRVIGSRLIGQRFLSPRFFHGRPSASDYDAMASGGTNLAPTNPELLVRVRANLDAFRRQNPGMAGIPADMVMSSGSGLDPHISVAAAEAQIPRVARATGIGEGILRSLVKEHTEPPDAGIFGERRVNVLLLNLAVARRIGEAE